MLILQVKTQFELEDLPLISQKSDLIFKYLLQDFLAEYLEQNLHK